MTTTSPLLDLPGEIRNLNYRYVVIEHTPIRPRFDRRLDAAGKIHYILQPERPALAAVCTTMRTEVLPLYYSENSFAFFDCHSHGNEVNTSQNIACTTEDFKQLAGDYIRHLRRADFTCDIYLPGYIRYPHTVKRFLQAEMLPDGKMSFVQSSEGAAFCVCDFHHARDRSMLSQRHGGHILEALRTLDGSKRRRD